MNSKFRKKLSAIILTAALLLSSITPINIFSASAETTSGITVWDGTAATAFASGTGTATDPYLIETPEQLAYLASVSHTDGKYYKLKNDIYLNDITAENWQKTAKSWYDSAVTGWATFTGTLDGDGHTVYGLYYSGSGDAGLIIWAIDAVISNLNIRECQINSSSTSVYGSAALCAYATGNVTLNRCTVDESVSVETTSKSAAALIASGSPANVKINNSFSMASITAREVVGAFIGDCWNGTSKVISNSFTAGVPFVGKNKHTLTNCYNTVDETSNASGSVTKLASVDMMKGANALTNMPNLKGWAATEGYPTPFINGKTGEVWSGAVALSFAGGNGTQGNPYIIETAEQLAKAVTENVSGAYYSISHDIYLNDVSKDNWAENSPNVWYDRADINKVAFVGTIDGNGNTIYGLYYNGSDYAALLPQANNTTVKNLNLRKSYLKSTGEAVGGFICFGQGHVILSGCTMDETVEITGSTDAAGFVSYGTPSVTISGSYCAAQIIGVRITASFIGDCWYAQGAELTIKNSFAVGNPLTGEKYSFTAINCYNTVADSKLTSGSTVTKLASADSMKGANALTNMPNLSGWYETDGYPSRYYNGRVGIVWSGAVADSFAGGTGTSSDPFMIKTAEQLAKVLNFPTNGYYFKLSADIILSNDTVAENWFDGSNSQVFAGNFDGDNHIISGLKYSANSNGRAFVALFPKTGAAGKETEISQVILENSDISLVMVDSANDTYVGGIVGFVTGATKVTACYVNDSVNLSNTFAEGQSSNKIGVGGIVGGGEANTVISDCASFATLTCPGRLGALIGNVWSGWKGIYNSISGGYAPVGFGKFYGSNSVSDTAPLSESDNDGNFTVVDSLKGEAGLAAIVKVNYSGQYFGVENGYPQRSAVAKRFNDVNGDRNLSSDDLVMLRKNLLGVTTLGYADINSDGDGNILDLIRLKKLLVEEANTYKLVWSDEFDGSSLEKKNWTTDITKTRMHNTDELFQEYTGRTLNVSGGNLNLTAGVNPFYDANGDTSFEKHKYVTVGSVTTENTMSFKYGKLEVRAKVPFKSGCWPSLWLRSHNATGKQQNPNYELEIDIFEVFGAADRLRANLHQQCINGESGNSKMTDYQDEDYVFANSENLSNEFHIYGFEWTPEKMSVSIDGVVYCTWNLDSASLKSYGLLGDVSGFDTTLNILFNNHLFTATSEYIEGDLIENNESNLPAEYVIDYVRLYQKNDGLSKIYFN